MQCPGGQDRTRLHGGHRTRLHRGAPSIAKITPAIFEATQPRDEGFGQPSEASLWSISKYVCKAFGREGGDYRRSIRRFRGTRGYWQMVEGYRENHRYLEMMAVKARVTTMRILAGVMGLVIEVALRETVMEVISTRLTRRTAPTMAPLDQGAHRISVSLRKMSGSTKR